MNQFFNIKRFGRLLAYDLKINYKQYLIAAAICLIAVFVVSYVIIDDYIIEHGQVINMYAQSLMICFAGYVVFAGLSFPAFSSKKSTISYLMLPASTFEKYTAEFIIRIILGGIFFVLIFWISANCAAEVKCFAYNLENHTNLSANHFSLSNLINNIFYIRSQYNVFEARTITTEDLSVKMFFVTLVVFGFSVRLFFKRFGLVKTAASGIAILLIVFYSLFYFGNRESSMFLVTNFQVMFFNRFIAIILIIFCVTLLLTGYYKLKEKKI